MNLINLQTLDSDIRTLHDRVKARAASSATNSADVSGHPRSLNTAPYFYIPDPLDECANALGHLADLWSVVRVTAHVSAAHASGSIGPSLSILDEQEDSCESCISIARLGSGDQTVVFPTADAATWLRNPGVYEMKLMKRQVPGTPEDVLMVQRLTASWKVRGAFPWLLDHLGLSDAMEFDLNRVLASMKPVHQAFFVAAISRPDIEFQLTAAGVPGAHPLTCGIRAAMALSTLDLDRDEASLARLACLVSDIDALQADAVPASLDELSSLMLDCGIQGAYNGRAHPRTTTFLKSLLNRFAELEPQDAVDLEGLLGTEAHRPFRIGSKDGGPFSDRPVDPSLARMGCAMGNALSQARRDLSREIQVSQAQAQPDSVINACDKPASVEGSASDDASSNFPDTPLIDIDHTTAHELECGQDTQTLDGEEGIAASSALAMIPIASLVPSADDLRLDLDRFNDRGDEPRPSLAWAAGMLDGDGCIAIVRQQYPDRSTIYRLTVSVCQNCRQTLEHFRRCVGVAGVIYAVKRKLEHNKQVYTLNYSGPKALLVIRRLRSLLVRKRPEAFVAISFCLNGQISRRFGPHGVPTDVEALRVAHYLKLRALK